MSEWQDCRINVYQHCHKCGRQGEKREIERGWLWPYMVSIGPQTIQQTVLCPDCAKWHLRFILKGRRIGPWLNWLYPTIGYCRRCKTSWQFVEGHATYFKEGTGCSPLCDACWSELTANERLPYYRDLYDLWLSQGYTGNEWRDIKGAVLRGL